jgi:uroporphyrinogen decarboxylase
MMTPKERVLSSLQHREPDRVPTGETGVDYSVSEQLLGYSTLYRGKWKEYQALWHGRRDEYVESCKRTIVDLALKLEWDFVPVHLVPSRNAILEPPVFLDKYIWQEADGRIMQFSPESEGHAVTIRVPTRSLDDLVEEDVVIDPSQLELVDYVTSELGATHFILGRSEDGSFPHEKFGLSELLMAMVDNPAFVHRAIEIETRKAVATINALLDAGCDGVCPGNDYCSSRGPMMSPAHFREYIFPALSAMCQATHAKGKYMIKHTDGNTWAILDMLIDAGIDAWQGIQQTIGMGLSDLKTKYGNRLSLWGGVDLDYLVSGTPDQICQITRQAIDAAAPGGGFVLTSGNTLMVGVRVENYIAMLETNKSYGVYPIQRGKAFGR